MKAIRRLFSLLACIFFLQTSYAVQIRRGPGLHIPEYILPTDHDNPAVWARTSAVATRGMPPGYYANNDTPRTGTQEYLLVLVDFKDLPFFIKDTSELLECYNRMYNEQGYSDPTSFTRQGVTYYGATGSVSDYFRDQSYGQFNPQFKIVGPIHLSQSYAYYGSGSKDVNVRYMIKEICDSLAVNDTVNLAGYARNGKIDQLSIIYAGRGENYYNSDVNTIWPHASIYNYGKSGIGDIKYVCTCELFWDSDTILDGIGTFCHEFSHTLGLPDFYNTSSDTDSEKNAAMGFWSLMDYGTYENGGFSPVGYTAFEKYSLGWLDLEEIDYSGYYTLDNISCKPDPDADIHTAYRLNAGNANQFLILENHIKTGWYKYHAAEGLMVTSVSYYNNSWVGNTVNNTVKRYRILPADNDYSRTSNAGDLFPYRDIDSITTLGQPCLSVESSFPAYSIYGINRNGSLVSFHASPDLPSGVTGTYAQDISINIENGLLTVTAPVGSRITVHNISGRAVLETMTTQPTQHISLPEQGIWIVRCGNITRKVRN